MDKREAVRDMLKVLLEQIDHDIAKSYDPETAEEPEFAEDDMNELIDIVMFQLGFALK